MPGITATLYINGPHQFRTITAVGRKLVLHQHNFQTATLILALQIQRADDIFESTALTVIAATPLDLII